MTTRSKQLPPPLPPEERTVGQLIAEAIRLYGANFWSSLALGLGPVVLAIVARSLSDSGRLVFALTASALVLTVCYGAATLIASDAELTRRSALVALAAGMLVLAPVPFLARLYILPSVAWLAAFGLAVPVALIERRGLRASFGRAFALARADFVHAAGSLAALTIVAIVSAGALNFLFVQFGDQAGSGAALLGLLVLSPGLFLGAALLYFDQAARLRSRERAERSSDADLHHAVDPDRAGRSNAQVEP